MTDLAWPMSQQGDFVVLSSQKSMDRTELNFEESIGQPLMFLVNVLDIL